MPEQLINSLIWLAVTSILAGIAFVFKGIVKPWSDSALRRSEAFVAHVDTVGRCLETLTDSFKAVASNTEKTAVASEQQTDEIKKLAEVVTVQTEWLRQLGSDPTQICKSEGTPNVT